MGGLHFSDTNQVFSKITSRANFLQAIPPITYIGKSTHVDCALDNMTREIQNHQHHPGKPMHLEVVVTDGMENGYLCGGMKNAAERAKDLGYQLFAVGVSTVGKNKEGLRQIASSPVAMFNGNLVAVNLTSGTISSATIDRIVEAMKYCAFLEGERGPDGPDGDKGRRGGEDNQGIDGPMGCPGSKGICGPKGPMGDVGGQGSKGGMGDTGWKGTDGQKGPSGNPGPAGVCLSQGTKGDRGVNGHPGRPGPHGPQGDVGPKGDMGVPGKVRCPGMNGTEVGDLNIKFVYFLCCFACFKCSVTYSHFFQGDPGVKGQGTRVDVGIKGTKGHVGWKGEKGDHGSEGFCGFPGTPGTAGCKGHCGPPGVRGPPGERGFPGDKGSTGDPGDNGAQRGRWSPRTKG
ncbi:collagen alpha-2(VI) chain-like isoform X2 [Alosa sapidissima]|uniref:collagen alpha-2(VI) chain-like isoform X2 n=1 Tax=Alosa sapidissima TaxID=34773 RepID=UPI001C095B51|nr:collagen alpha-2(VI) chain-like isoform X2 [Alosa sapidissima]